MSETMTEEQILADLEAFDKEPVPDVRERVAQKISPATPSSVTQQAKEGEVPAEVDGRVEDDAGKAEETAVGTEPKEGENRVRDPKTGQFVKKEAEIPEKDTEKLAAGDVEGDKVGDQPERVAESKYEKAKKEVERQKSLLKGFDEQKAQFWSEAKAKEAALEKERQRLADEAVKIRQQRNGQRPTDENGQPIYTSYELRDLAEDYWERALKGEEGPNGENYAEVSKRAKAAAKQAEQRELKEQQEVFDRHQTQLAMEVVTAHPELADQNSPLTKEIQAVFAEEAELSRKFERPSIFRIIPDGFERALDVALLRREAFEKDHYKAKAEELQKEVDRLNSLNTLGSSSPVQARQPKPQEQMTADELLDQMDEQARKQGAKIWKR